MGSTDMSLARLDVEEIIGYELWVLIHINKTVWKKRSQFIQELLAYDAGEAESFLSDTRREASVKRIDLALDPELIFSEGNWRFGILS
jgi:hypothetical protein